MMKLQGIVSEISIVKPQAKKDIPVFIETFRSSNAIAYVPALKSAPQGPDKKKRRKKFIVGLTVTAFLVIASVLGLFNLIGNKGDTLEDKVEWVVVSVEQGDTLWELVKEHKTNDQVDVRELIDLVKRHNKLGQASLRVGMTIEIPVIKEVK